MHTTGANKRTRRHLKAITLKGLVHSRRADILLIMLEIDFVQLERCSKWPHSSSKIMRIRFFMFL